MQLGWPSIRPTSRCLKSLPLAVFPETWDDDWIPGWDRLFEQGGILDREHSYAL